MRKTNLILILMFIVFSNFVFSETIENNRVYVDNDLFYLSAYPNERIGSGWVYNEFMSKGFEGNLNIVYGFDKNTVIPKKIYYYNPKEKSRIETKTYNIKNVSLFYNTNNLCDIGNIDYNKYKKAVSYNGTIKTICFNEYIKEENENNYIILINYNVSYIEKWQKLNNNIFEKINYNYDNKNIWYKISNFNVKKNKIYKIKFFLDIDKNTNGKYDIAFYPSVYDNNLINAYHTDKLFLLDPIYNYTTVPQGIIYYPFDDDCRDLWGSNDCVLNGATINTSGFVNKGAYFVGSPKYISINDSIGIFDGTNDFSLTVSIYALNTIFDRIDFRNFIEFEGEYNIGLDYDKGTDKLRAYNTYVVGGWKPIYSLNTVSGSNWYNIVYTYSIVDGIKLYVNGNLHDTDGTTGAIDPQAFSSNIGIFRDDISRQFQGYIDEVAIWDYELNLTQIQDMYEHLTNGFSLNENSPSGIYINVTNFTITPKLNISYFGNYTPSIFINTSYENLNVTLKYDYNNVDVNNSHFNVNGSIINELNNISMYNITKYTFIGSIFADLLYPQIAFENDFLFWNNKHNFDTFNGYEIEVLKFNNPFDINGTFLNQEIGNQFYLIFTPNLYNINQKWNLSYINNTLCNTSNWFKFNSKNNSRKNITLGCPDVHTHISRYNNTIAMDIEFNAFEISNNANLGLYIGSNNTNEDIFLNNNWKSNSEISLISVIPYQEDFNHLHSNNSKHKLRKLLTLNNKNSNDSINFTVMTNYSNTSFIRFFYDVGNIKPTAQGIISPSELETINQSSYIFKWQPFLDFNGDSLSYDVVIYEYLTGYKYLICNTSNTNCSFNFNSIPNNRDYITSVIGSDGKSFVALNQSTYFSLSLSSIGLANVYVDMDIIYLLFGLGIYFIMFIISFITQQIILFKFNFIYGILFSIYMLDNLNNFIPVTFLMINIILLLLIIFKKND